MKKCVFFSKNKKNGNKLRVQVGIIIGTPIGFEEKKVGRNVPKNSINSV